MTTLVIAEHNNLDLNNSIRHLITAANKLTQDIHVLVAGYNCNSIVEQAMQLSNVKLILQADNLCYQYQLAENIAALVQSMATDYNYILAPANTFGKNILPRIAGLLDVGQISDVIQIISADTFVRPIYAGNALATVQSLEKIKLLSIRTTAFEACDLKNNSCLSKQIDKIFDLKLSNYVSSSSIVKTTRPALANARVIVAGGRGLQSKENFTLLEQLAEQLNAAIGASRAAVDAGFVANDCQVGQTGKIVAPELYIAIGISGAIQHLAGMKDSKVIVAINIDSEAPIFKVADYGLVGDLFDIVPEIIKELSN